MEETDYGLAAGESYAPEDDEEPFDPRAPHVMTVLGPVDPGALGLTLSHEHLLWNPAALGGHTDAALDDPYRTLTALESFAETGGGAIVDLSTDDDGRDLPGLLWIARRSPIHVIAATGSGGGSLSHDPYGPGDSDRLATDWVHELTNGAGDSGVRPGIIRVGSSSGPAREAGRRELRAAALAHRETGVPVAVDANGVTGTVEPLSELMDVGVAAERVIVGHLDELSDQAAFRVMVQGPYGAIDHVGQGDARADERRADLAAALIGAGHGERILLSHGLGRRSQIPSYGGSPGWSHIPERFVLSLMARGISAAAVHRLLVTNPASALTIRRPG